MNPVNPADESAFPGLSQATAELRTWEWTFGKTPKFSIQTVLKLMDDRSLECSTGQLHMVIKNGIIESCVLDIPSDWLPQRLSRDLSSMLVGERFCGHRVAVVVTALLRCEGGELQDRLHNLCDAVVAMMG